MKQIITTLTAILFFTTFLFAQSVPNGMKYQAAARDAQGELLANQEISLKSVWLKAKHRAKLLTAKYIP